MTLLDRVRTQKLLSFTLALFTLCLGVVIGTLLTSGVKAAKDGPAAPGAQELKIPDPVELSTTFSQIAKQLEPSVVNIQITYNPKPARTGRNQRRQAEPFEDQEGGGGMDDFFYRFFGNPFGGTTPDMPQRGGESLGSGVVVDRAGDILTNNHVVDKADRIQVKFTGDPISYDAKVIGVDAPTDLAVIRVEGKTNLTPARIGNSDAVQVGDWAVAIGSPFGFQATVTAGIISARERDIPGDTSSQFQHFLQTDAAINPGNSGGPLLNVRGEVIGINTAIASRTGGYQGIGFALPVNMAVSVYNQIIKGGKVVRGSIGIRFTRSDTDQARALLKRQGLSEGVFVQEVTPGGPSDKAGLQAGDVIVSLNAKPVKNGDELINTVTATPVGQAVTVGVSREGKRQEFKVVVGDLAQIFPDDFGTADAGDAKPEGATARFGITIQDLSPQRRQTLGIKETGGVEIQSIEPNSFAEDIGMRRGDILLSINRQPVNTVDDVTRIQSTLKAGSAVEFRVLQRGAAGRSTEWTSTFLAGVLPQ